MTHTKAFATLLLLLTLAAHASAQTPAVTTPAPAPRKAPQPRQPKGEADPLAAPRRAQAAALLTSLADDARAANSAPAFTGDDGKVVVEFRTKHSGWMTDFNAKEFDLADVLTALAGDDWDHAVQLAQSFTGEAARTTAVVTIARAALIRKGR
jgi:hypothetical protein